jgi:hypothetical protein
MLAGSANSPYIEIKAAIPGKNCQERIKGYTRSSQQKTVFHNASADPQQNILSSPGGDLRRSLGGAPTFGFAFPAVASRRGPRVGALLGVPVMRSAGATAGEPDCQNKGADNDSPWGHLVSDG